MKQAYTASAHAGHGPKQTAFRISMSLAFMQCIAMIIDSHGVVHMRLKRARITTDTYSGLCSQECQSS